MSVSSNLKILRVLLYPFVPVYALVVSIRNFLFNRGIFKSRKTAAGVISVGNLNVGGSGKTPLVLYLCGILTKQKKKTGVLSRGYGRKTKGYLLVSDGKEIKTPVEDCGDEIFLTVSECNVPAAVSENRVQGAGKLIADTGVDTIVLDDAFQHRWIFRDIDLLIIEQKFLFCVEKFNCTLLPTGNMREGFSSIKRADAVVINRKFSKKKEIPTRFARFFENKKVFTACYKSVGFIDVKTRAFYPIGEFAGQKSLVVSGVANPHSFLNALKQSNISTLHTLIFKDHKKYSEKEIQKIRKEFYAVNAHSVITTHKDAVKFAQFSEQLDDIDLYYLKIVMDFDNGKEFDEFIINKINNCS
jgi:tetraacyldisaccharide 4'-kinase